MHTRPSRTRSILTLMGQVLLACLVFGAAVPVSFASSGPFRHDAAPVQVSVPVPVSGHGGGAHGVMSSTMATSAEPCANLDPVPEPCCPDAGAGCRNECAASCASMAGCTPAVAARPALCPLPTFGAIGHLAARAAGLRDSAGTGPPLRPPIL